MTTGNPAAAATRDETLAKSYLYVRVALVAVLVFLAVAVVYQSLRQGSILSSISAYYYTPAQAVFVGALVALGVSMIALQGTTRAEDVLLNVGGMLAPVVAIVPTSRGADFRAAVKACEQSDGAGFGAQGAAPVDCPTVRALVESAEASIDNNMWALFVAGLLALAITPTLFRRFGKPFAEIRRSYGFAVLLFVLALGSFVFLRQQFIDLAHYAAAIGLFVCIFLVAVVNARRERAVPAPGPANWTRVYAGVAAAMVVAAAVGIPLAAFEVFPSALFFLEAALILLFAVFWVFQTVENWQVGDPPAAEAGATRSRDRERT